MLRGVFVATAMPGSGGTRVAIPRPKVSVPSKQHRGRTYSLPVASRGIDRAFDLFAICARVVC